MALGIYSDTDMSNAFSSDGSFSKPLAFTADGVIGSSCERRLYVHNEDVSKTYSNIEITPIDGGDGIVSTPNTGFTWKLMEGDQRPLKEQWDAIDAGTTLVLTDSLTDTNIYLPFWIQVAIPEGADITSYQSVKLQVVADEA
jgi:hypothetical protein